jgi:5-methylcytosine-specific restriction endonuclease McrA
MPHKKALDHADGTRTCTKCKKRLSIDKFHKDKTATGGHRAKCKKCRIDLVTNWYSKNRIRQAGKEKKRRLSNPEKYTKLGAIRYARDRDKHIAYATTASHKRRAKKKKGKVERGISKLSLKKKFGSKCYYCGKEMDFSTGIGRKFNRDMATIEHLIPIQDGGGHTWDNTVLACRFCNISKGSKTIKEFKEHRNKDG